MLITVFPTRLFWIRMLFRNEGDVGHQATPCESLPDGRAVADTGRGWEGRAHEAQNFTSFLHISIFFLIFQG